MFDPHRTRQSNRRYFTRKGQVIHAKLVNPPIRIDRDTAEIYKEYLIKNHMINLNPPAPVYQNITIDKITTINGDVLFSTFLYAISSSTVQFTNPGWHLVISIAEDNDSYEFWVEVTNATSYNVENGKYYYNENLEDSSYYASLMSGNKEVIMFFNTGNDENVSFQIKKDYFTIKGLPAPSA